MRARRRVRSGRLGRRIGIALLLVAVVFLAATARLFLWPSSASPGRADAVVLFAGGRGERLEQATVLIRAGVASRLVISNGWDPVWPQANRLCRDWPGVQVYCPKPRPDTTQGEARTIAALARQHGWRSLVLVTSSYHVQRARLWLRRCHQGEVHVVAARPRASPALVRWVGYEWVAFVSALTVRRHCR
ncbi:MAG: YdcF family protein [Streptosporangiales bacterium]|nr:YdcF family protein [Streptosporangiales bacterium]